MKLKLKINEHTTDSELVHLGNFFSALGLNRGAHVISAPADEAEYTVIIPPTNTTEQELRDGELVKIEGINILTGKPEPKRRRRTKEEIAAAEAAAVAAAKAEAQASNEAALAAAESEFKKEINAIEAEAKAKAEAGKDQPAPTPTATATDTPAASSSEGAAQTPATESPSDTKTYTPAEVQKIAVATAGRFGPEKVKALIAQYQGAARIADLPLTELAGFVAKLNAVS